LQATEKIQIHTIEERWFYSCCWRLWSIFFCWNQV